MKNSLLNFQFAIIFFTIITFLSHPHFSFAAEPFAVVELFTSEGCSSCPPADEVLQELTKIAQRQNKEIYTLGFHVDYWNYLGWRDPFSQEEFTERQRYYARVFNARSVYTPQMIINGNVSFGGYDYSRAQKEIDKALSKSASDQKLFITTSEISFNKILMQYKIEGMTPNSLLNFALIQKKAHSDVTSGENAGKNLDHVHVVKDFKTLDLDKPTGQYSLSLPNGTNPQDFLIIVFIQNATDMTVSAVAQINLSKN